jgi:hypothetical protein
MNSSLVPLTTAQGQVPALVAASGELAGMRFLEFFAANIRNPHTRRAQCFTACFDEPVAAHNSRVASCQLPSAASTVEPAGAGASAALSLVRSFRLIAASGSLKAFSSLTIAPVIKSIIAGH